MADTKDVVKATDDRKGKDVERDGPRQTVVREPDEETFGPLFPSGMSAPEAAVAGATADLSDEQRSAFENAKAGRSSKKTTKRDDD